MAEEPEEVEEEQRVAAARLGRLHGADPDRVVPAGHETLEPAPHPGDRAVEHRHAAVDAMRHLGELRLLGRLGGEQPREVLLAGAQDVDAERARLAHDRERACAAVEAHEQQQGVERERADGVRRHAHRTQRRGGGDDRHAGREVPHHGPELVGAHGLQR
jgi:hypothetical protein